jgi:hypothetical protein
MGREDKQGKAIAELLGRQLERTQVLSLSLSLDLSVLLSPENKEPPTGVPIRGLLEQIGEGDRQSSRPHHT